jgi:hypothetical protein
MLDLLIELFELFVWFSKKLGAVRERFSGLNCLRIPTKQKSDTHDRGST